MFVFSFRLGLRLVRRLLGDMLRIWLCRRGHGYALCWWGRLRDMLRARPGGMACCSASRVLRFCEKRFVNA